MEGRGKEWTYAVAPVCAWFVEKGLGQDAGWMSVELVDADWLTV